MGDALTAARTWLRECPLIDKNDRFNVNYLGDRAVEYALTLASETHKEDVCGYDIATYNMVFLARLPFGAHMGTNIASAELFSGLSRWIRAQNRTRRYPQASMDTMSNASAQRTPELSLLPAQTPQNINYKFN